MNRLFRVLALLLLFLGASCAKNDFSVDFDLNDDFTENYTVTYYATAKDGGGLTIQSVAPVLHGKSEFSGKTLLPTLLYVSAKSAKTPLVIYAEAGNKIKVTGEGKDPLAWNVEGNEINAELSAWRIENIDSLAGGNRMAINRLVEDYVKEHTSSPSALIILMTYFDRPSDEWLYASLMASLRGEAAEENWLKTVARADQLTARVSNPAKLYSLVMRSAHHGADTLRISKEGSTFLMFRQNGLPEHKAFMDSLKSLRKEFPDSSINVIADIDLDTDSLVWKNALKRDSLENISRFWIPAGLADINVMKLKVKSIPYFIVIDREGLQAYRGNDIASAMNEFRNISNNCDMVAETDN